MLKRLKWLQWSKSNLEKDLGGVEEHARCVARELRRLGIEAHFSSDPAELWNSKWDVIHTHGGTVAAVKTGAIHVHTLHGTTLGRMAACGEWLWPGGYLAAAREFYAVLRADLILSVHPKLSLYRFSQKIGKPSALCGNGWDSGDGPTPELPESVREGLDSTRPLWLYVGRGDDTVKGADRVRETLRQAKNLQLMAVPGTGFESEADVFKTGRLSASEVRCLFERADGLLAPSRYEGNSLVVLEALAAGISVISTSVGAAPFFPVGILGLQVVPSAEPREIAAAILAGDRANPRIERARRASVNRSLLPTWGSVVSIAVDAVERVRKSRLP